jgi:glycosyltransferase involved in cell wall biosynthesis
LLACRLAATIAGHPAPIAAVYHSTVLRNRKEELLQLLHTPIFNRIAEVIFISSNQRRFWKQRGFRPRHESVILNGVDTDRYSPGVRDRHRTRIRSLLGIEPDTFVIGISAVMRPEKNHIEMIDAVAALRAQGIAATALMVGDGPLRTAILSRAADRGIDKHLLLVGMQNDVAPWISAFDVGVLSSTAIETLSLSALEVMAMGIPMIMSDLGGASEIVDGSNGGLYKVRDLSGLCDRLAEFHDVDRRCKAGLAARATIERQFDCRKMVRAYADTFRAIVGRTN